MDIVALAVVEGMVSLRPSVERWRRAFSPTPIKIVILIKVIFNETVATNSGTN